MDPMGIVKYCKAMAMVNYKKTVVSHFWPQNQTVQGRAARLLILKEPSSQASWVVVHTDKNRYFTCPACHSHVHEPFCTPPTTSSCIKREFSCLVFGRLFTGLKALKEIGFASDARLLLGPTGLKEWKTTVRKDSHLLESTSARKDSCLSWLVGSKDPAKEKLSGPQKSIFSKLRSTWIMP